MTTIIGRVWRFDHNVDTDVMAPWTVMSQPWEERKNVVLHINPRFASEVQPGDVIVAGRNWGCGSSREQAPENLQRLGVAAVVAESFGRIYFRNSVAIAFPNVVCPGAWEAFKDGDELELELESARVRNVTQGTALQGQPYTDEMLAIIKAGGLMNVLRQSLGKDPKGSAGRR
jgi:3-isopropylmalate/(R)-2-methylmalate dehydratase small subunit